MSSRLAADRRVRAAALQAAPGLDVRGPVSRALGRAGITVPPAPLAADEPAAPGEARAASGAAPVGSRATGGRPERPTASGPPAAPRVVKPFAPAPWPTRRPAPLAAPPPAVLSGLTADERRVHRILLDSLARTNTLDGVSDGLTYVEKKRLATLDLPYIDAEIARMKARPSISGLRWLLVALAVGAALPLLAVGDVGSPTDKLTLFVVGMLCAVGVLRGARKPGGHTQRLAVFRALRELALLADPDDVTSDAVRQADAVIDRLARAPGGVADDAARLDGAPRSAASGAPRRGRARS